ncbi:uncharacterized protein C8A04DRAFT_39470 [Dichotomopilus funicola]|uniref:AB hydrolase-1 domain-containing protein n=1 Tax=Dichotomopilus funicola TaxID=1934379 RepID=A0AAN6ZK91_9PEZI|nr:hypothetical protein C8A04DRAFT_39470 [Dichotomopilus funicola]
MANAHSRLSGFSLSALALAHLATAAPSTISTTNTKTCVQLEVPVPVVATNYHYTQPPVDSSIDAIDWTINVTSWSHQAPVAADLPKVLVNDKFVISAQLCVPTAQGPKAGILQIATPGLGFGKAYWDVDFNRAKYSYVDAAIAQGYSILTYDRLGTGGSAKPDAYDVVQIPTEVEVLAGLTKLARDGKLLSTSKIASANGNGKGKGKGSDKMATIPTDFTPTKIVQIGHSFGAYLLALGLASHGNDLADGVILTGLLPTKLPLIDVLHYDHEFAAEHDPVRFGGYKSGYFVLGTNSVLQKLFLRKGAFEGEEMLKYIQRTKEPESVGEYASEALNPLAPVEKYTGPVQFFNGEFDNFICIGDCRGTYDEEIASGLFPHVSHKESYLQPNTGHALTVATNATAGYDVIMQFLDKWGL